VLGEWRSYPWRVVLALAAIATGVALGFCVHLVNGSAISHFSDAVNAVSGQYDLEIVAREASGLNDALYPRLAMLPEVAVAAPSLDVNVFVPESTGGTSPSTSPGSGTLLHVVGVDVFTARDLNPVAAALGSASNSGDLFAAGAIFLNPALIDQLHRQVGAALGVVIDGQTVALHIAGALPSSDPHLAMMDIGNAQWQLHRMHRLTRIALRRAPGVSLAQLRRALLPLLPQNTLLVSPQDDATQTDRLSRAYRVNLDMLALMALFTGAFLVYSTQSLSILRRARQNALLRVLGLTQNELLVQVLAEGALLGALGSLLGLLGGGVLARLVLHAFGGDLGGGYFGAQSSALVFSPAAAMAFFVLGIAAAIAGSLLPARRAARNASAAALKAQDEAFDPKRAPPITVPVILALCALICLVLPAINSVPFGAYLAMALLLLATIAAMPALVRAGVGLTRRLLREASIPTELALSRLWAAPTQGTIALSGIVASASLMVAMATMVFSFRSSVDNWLSSILSADVYLHIAGPSDSYALDEATQQALSHLPGVTRVSFLTTENLSLAPDRPAVTLMVRDYLGDRPAGLPVIETAASSSAGTGLPAIWISEAMRELYHWNNADIEHLSLDGSDGSSHEIAVRVAGIWRDYARQNGSVVMDSASYSKLTGRMSRSDAAFTLAPGQSATHLEDLIRQTLPQVLNGHLQLASPAEIRRTSLVIFDRSFAITYLLEAVAIGIGLAGVAATFSAQTIARAREFGMLRHLGVRRAEIMQMLVTEGFGLGVIGVLCGFLVGLLEGKVLIKRVNPQSFHWSMDTHIPWPLIIGIALAMLLASAGTALLSGRGALSTSAIRAVREDW
jgi:putative ABC transport system permease protein